VDASLQAQPFLRHALLEADLAKRFPQPKKERIRRWGRTHAADACSLIVLALQPERVIVAPAWGS